MLSRFFQRDDSKQQQQGQLGNVDALDGEFNDPRQSPNPRQTAAPVQKHDDDDDESAMDMSFMDSPSDDDRTVDTTNSGMVMDMVKNSFLQGLAEEQGNVKEEDGDGSRGDGEEDEVNSYTDDDDKAPYPDDDDDENSYTKDDDDENSYAEDDHDENSYSNDQDSPYPDENDDNSYASDDDGENSYDDDGDNSYTDENDQNSYADGSGDDDESGCYSIDDDDSDVGKDDDDNDGGTDDGDNDDAQETQTQPRWGGRWLTTAKPREEAEVTDDSKRRRGWWRGNTEESTNDDEDVSENNNKSENAVASSSRLGRILGRGNSSDVPDGSPPSEDNGDPLNEKKDDLPNEDKGDNSDHSNEEEIVEVNDDDDDDSKMSSEEKNQPPQSRFGWGAIRPAAVTLPAPAAEEESATPSSRRRRWGWNKGEVSENEDAAESNSEVSETTPSTSRRRWGWSSRSDESQRSDNQKGDGQHPPCKDDSSVDAETTRSDKNDDQKLATNIEADLSNSSNSNGNRKEVTSSQSSDESDHEDDSSSHGRDYNEESSRQTEQPANVDENIPTPSSGLEEQHEKDVRRTSSSDLGPLASKVSPSSPTTAEDDSTAGSDLLSTIPSSAAEDTAAQNDQDNPSAASAASLDQPVLPPEQTIFGRSHNSDGSARSIIAASNNSDENITSSSRDIKLSTDTEKADLTANRSPVIEELEHLENRGQDVLKESRQEDADPSDDSSTSAEASCGDSIQGNNLVGSPSSESTESSTKDILNGETRTTGLPTSEHVLTEEVPASDGNKASSLVSGNETGTSSLGLDAKQSDVDQTASGDVKEEGCAHSAKGPTVSSNRRSQMKKQKSWFDVVMGADDDTGNEEGDVAESKDQSDGSKGWFDSILGPAKEDNPGFVPKSSAGLSTNLSENEIASPLDPDPSKAIDRRAELTRSKSWLESVFVGESEVSGQEKATSTSKPGVELGSTKDESTASTPDRRQELTRSKSWLESVFAGDSNNDVAPDYVMKSACVEKVSLAGVKPKSESDGARIESIKANETQLTVDDVAPSKESTTLVPDRRKELTRTKSWLESVLAGDTGDDAAPDYVDKPCTGNEVSGVAPNLPAGSRRKDLPHSKSLLTSTPTEGEDVGDVGGSENPDDRICCETATSPAEDEEEKSRLDKTDSNQFSAAHNTGPKQASEKGLDNCDSAGLQKTVDPLKPTGNYSTEIKRSKSWLEAVLTGEDDSEVPGNKTKQDTGIAELANMERLDTVPHEAEPKHVGNSPDRRGKLTKSKSWLDGVLSQTDPPNNPHNDGLNPESQQQDRRSDLKRSKSWLESVFDTEGENSADNKPAAAHGGDSKSKIKADDNQKDSVGSEIRSREEVSQACKLSVDKGSTTSDVSTGDGRAGLQRSKSWLESVISGEDHKDQEEGRARTESRRDELKRTTSWLSLVLGEEADETPDYLKGQNESNGRNKTAGDDHSEKSEHDPKPFSFKSHKAAQAEKPAPPQQEGKLETGDTGMSVRSTTQPRQLTRSKSWLDVMLGDGDEGGDEEKTTSQNVGKPVELPSPGVKNRIELQRSKSWYESMVGEDDNLAGNSTAGTPSGAQQQSWLDSVFGPDDAKQPKDSPKRGVACTATSTLAEELHKKLQTIEADDEEGDESMKKMFTEDEPVEIKLTRKSSILSRSSSKGSFRGDDERDNEQAVSSAQSVPHNVSNLSTKRLPQQSMQNQQSSNQSKEKSIFAKRALYQAISSLSYKSDERSHGLQFSSRVVDIKGLAITKAIFGERISLDDALPSHNASMNEGMSVSDDDVPDYLRELEPTDKQPATENATSSSKTSDEEYVQKTTEVASEHKDAVSDSESSDKSDQSDEAEDDEGSDDFGKITVNKAPLLRLQNVTEATRQKIPDDKTKQASSRWKKWFGGKKATSQNTEQDPVEEDIVESEPSEASEEASSSLESEHSVSNGVVETEDDIKEVMPRVAEESSSESTDGSDDNPGKSQLQGHAALNALHTSMGGAAENEAQPSIENKKSSSNKEAEDLSRTAATLLKSLTPADIERITDSMTAQTSTATTTGPTTKIEKKTLSPKRRKKKSISTLLESNTARQVGRHGDEVSVGTMNIKKKSVQSGRMVMVSKTNALVFEEHNHYGQSRRRPWEIAMQKGPKKFIHETDPDDDDELKKVDILAKSEEFFGCEPLNSNLPVLAETIEESEEEESEEESEIHEAIELAQQKMSLETSTTEDFTEIWDDASCDESIAKAFMRSQQKKNHEKEKKRQRREQLKQERANVTKRLRLFERSGDSRQTKRGAKKSKLSEEFMIAIHRVFEEGSDCSLRSGSDESGSDGFSSSSGDASCRSIYLDEKLENDTEEESLGSQSEDSYGNDSGQPSHSAQSLTEGDDDASGPNMKSNRKQRRSKRKRDSKSTADASDMFMKEVERLQAPKIMTIEALRQEMVGRRGTSVNLLKKEYVTFKKKRSDKKFGAEDEEIRPIDFGALSAVQRRRNSYASTADDKSMDDEESLPGVGLAEKLSRWASAEGVTELDDLATVMLSPTKNVNMFGVSNANLKVPANLSPTKDPITPRATKSYNAPRPTSRPAARSASTGARVPRRRSEDSGAYSGVSLERPKVSMENPPQQMFAASFNDAPLNSIQEGSDNDEEFGLLSSLKKKDDSDDDQSFFSTSSSKKGSSNRFSLGAKVGSKMKKLVPKMPSMKVSRGRSGGGGFMLSDNDW